jgi:cytochrome c
MVDSFEINKILGAVLGTLLITLALNIISGSIFSPHKPDKPGYDIVVTEQPAAGGGTVVQEVPIEQLLAKANPEKGASVAKKCLACHDFTKGGPNKVGPNLYGIVNRDRATHEGFSYTAAMKAKGGKWTVQDLNTYLTNPRAFVPGTSMAFVGVSKGPDRADLIAYLNTLADNPAPLPIAPASDQQSAAPKDAPGQNAPAASSAPASDRQGAAPKTAPGQKAPAASPAPKH